MAATLEWIRDHYDVDKDRYITKSEVGNALDDYFANLITREQFYAVKAAYDSHTLLPAYGFYTMSVIDGHVISVNIPSGAMLKIEGVEVI